MVFFGVRIQNNIIANCAIESFNDNLRDHSKQGSSLMFKDDSGVTRVGDSDVVVVYLKSIIPVGMIVAIIGILAVITRLIFNIGWPLTIALFILALYLSRYLFIFWLFKKGLRKANYYGDVELI